MERLSPSTLYRANRLDRLLRPHLGALDLDAIRAALADHFAWPNAICRHPDARQPAAKRTMTNAAFVIDLATRTMHVADGPPCERSEEQTSELQSLMRISSAVFCLTKKMTSTRL